MLDNSETMMEGYVLVNRDEICPYINQPRKKFNQGKLLALARSIEKNGQLVPVIVRRLPLENKFKYELIAGERRHRACGIAGVKKMKAILKLVKDDREQHLLSVMENSNRVDCTIMETARSAKRIKDDYGWSDWKIGEEVYGKSGVWINNHICLLKLHPLVQEMIDEDEKKKRLPFTLAVKIAKEIPEQHREEQLEIARKIVSGEMRSLDARAHISKRSAELGVIHKERRRKPDDDYQVLSGIPKRAAIGLNFFTKKGQPGIDRIFRSRNHHDRENFINNLDVLAREINKLKDLIVAIS